MHSLIWTYDRAGHLGRGTSAAGAQGEAISTVLFEDAAHIFQDRARGQGGRICDRAEGEKGPLWPPLWLPLWPNFDSLEACDVYNAIASFSRGGTIESGTRRAAV